MRRTELELKPPITHLNDQGYLKRIVRDLIGSEKPLTFQTDKINSWSDAVADHVRQDHDRYWHYYPPETLSIHDWRAVPLLCVYMYPADFPPLSNRQLHWLREGQYLNGKLVCEQDRLLPYIEAYRKYYLS